jgi:zinc transporter ZupT
VLAYHFLGQSPLSLFFLSLTILITILFLPSTLAPPSPTVHHVFYYGWITALSTGLGVLPLLLLPSLPPGTVGRSLAVACGMMSAASYSLVSEGFDLPPAPGDATTGGATSRWTMCGGVKGRTVLGVLLGLLFIKCTQAFLDSHDGVSLQTFRNANAKKVLLILIVMTLHSFSEGVGIGVSFGGDHGPVLGRFISLSLAVHNIPEVSRGGGPGPSEA